MTKDLFWKIIDDANAEARTGGRDTMLRIVSSKLSELSADDIVDWKNLQDYYLKLADRKDLWHAASRCKLYLSDDSFLYFRSWLLSQGKDVFSSVLSNPCTLSQHITEPGSSYFESFNYVSHDAYRNKAFAEEYGPEGMKRYQDEWLAQHPQYTEFDPYWALDTKYDIYAACARRPLSEDTKAQLRNDIFSPISKENPIKWEKKRSGNAALEKAVQALLPQAKEYRRICVRLDSGYEWGHGILPAAAERFHQEMKTLFTGAGWEYLAPAFDNASPEYVKGKSRLYCHPMEVSGPCAASLMSEVAQLLEKAVTCKVTSLTEEGCVFDISDEEYTTVLTSLHANIEKDLLREFSLKNGMSDSDRRQAVMENFRILTLKKNSGVLSSNNPYWKYIESVFQSLVEQGKIIKKPTASRFSSQNYMTAPEYQIQENQKIDLQIRSAADRTSMAYAGDGEKNKEPER